MEIDEYINNLNSDLERQMSELSNSMDSMLNSCQPLADGLDDNEGGVMFCPECGTCLPAGSFFCSSCGTPIQNEIEELADESIQDKYVEDGDGLIEGIIFTDSKVLAKKYCCNAQKVRTIIDRFAKESTQYRMSWYIYDVQKISFELGAEFWEDYNDILSDFISRNGIKPGINTPVFIIGGSDVIPVPKLENPMTGELIPTDMPYCFNKTFFSDLYNGDCVLSEEYVRNTISRLPLEKGILETEVDELTDCLQRSLRNAQNGIPFHGVAMASNVEWTCNSVTMSQHLPLVFPKWRDEEEIHKGMFICPKLVVTNSGGESVDKKVLSDYKGAIGSADMLLFNLHGSNSKGNSSFYCESNRGYPESFNINMLGNSNASVFNTVACFGARYDGYDRDDSMLLSAFWDNSVNLYAGSSVSVPMIPDCDQDYPRGVRQYAGSGSEKLMPLYCYYLMLGLPAGKAMMKAKLDYFNTFREIERDDFSLATVMMFGLYGNPMLRMQQNKEAIERARRFNLLPGVSLGKSVKPAIRVKRMMCVVDKEHIRNSKSLLDQIRACVDNNLKVIHESVQKELKQTLGLDPCWLYEVDEYEMLNCKGCLEKGYMYRYDEHNEHHRQTLIEVNNKGKITRKVTFK